MDEVSHARKTVFTRYDEKRAGAILKPEAALQAFAWGSVTLTMPAFDEAPPTQNYLVKSFELNALANTVMQVVGENSFFYTQALRARLAVEWYPHARAYAMKCVETGTELANNESFIEATRSVQIKMLRETHTSETEQFSNKVRLPGVN